MKSKTYMIAWDGCLENALDIHSQLSEGGIDYLVWNVSSQDIDDKHWVRAEDIRYYGHFWNSLKDFRDSDFDIFIFNAGDPEYAHYAELTGRIENLFESDENIGVFAPSIRNDAFSDHQSSIQASVKHEGLYLSTMTNGIYVAMSRDIATMFADYMDQAVKDGDIVLGVMQSGWGIDVAYCTLSMCLNKKVYRGITKLDHPLPSSYDHGKANKEYGRVFNSFVKYVHNYGLDEHQVALVMNQVLRSPYLAQSGGLRVKDFYPNLSGKLDI